MYHWDEVNAREQLVYGDTGLRNIINQAVTPTGQLYIRRVGLLVTIHAFAATHATASATFDITFASGQVPGFNPAQNVRTVAINAAGTAKIVDITTATEIRYYQPEATAYSWSITYSTNDAWPTVLPGLPSGAPSVPNI
jgi:hypothetical protein